MPRSVDLLRACGAVTAVTTAIASESGLPLVRGDDSHVGSVVAERFRRPLDAVLSQIKAGKRPKSSSKRRRNTASEQVRDLIIYEHEAKNPQFKIDTEQRWGI